MVVKLSKKVENLLELAEQCFDREVVEDYERLDLQVREIEAAAREAFQEKLEQEYIGVVEKLERGQALDASDRRMIELLIIGDAEYYLRYENDFSKWKVELQRLMGEIEHLHDKGLDQSHALLQLQAYCRDARGVMPELTFYLRERKRVKDFQVGTWGRFRPEIGKVLADFLRAIMESDAM